MNRFITFVLAAFIGMPVVFGQTTIKGKVFSKTDGKAIAGATVIAKDSPDILTLSDSEGNFKIKVPHGTEALEVNAAGYTSKTRGIEGKKNVNFELAPASTDPRVNMMKSHHIKVSQPATIDEKLTK